MGLNPEYMQTKNSAYYITLVTDYRYVIGMVAIEVKL